MKNITIISLFLVGNFSVVFSQHTIQLPSVNPSSFIPSIAKSESQISTLTNSKNEVDLTMTLLFNGYKIFFSSQDLNTCTFIPSCSVYGLQAIKKRGLVMGGIQTFDRLSRCHGFAQELYEKDEQNALQIDRP